MACTVSHMGMTGIGGVCLASMAGVVSQVGVTCIGKLSIGVPVVGCVCVWTSCGCALGLGGRCCECTVLAVGVGALCAVHSQDVMPRGRLCLD